MAASPVRHVPRHVGLGAPVKSAAAVASALWQPLQVWTLSVHFSHAWPGRSGSHAPPPRLPLAQPACHHACRAGISPSARADARAIGSHEHCLGCTSRSAHPHAEIVMGCSGCDKTSRGSNAQTPLRPGGCAQPCHLQLQVGSSVAAQEDANAPSWDMYAAATANQTAGMSMAGVCTPDAAAELPASKRRRGTHGGDNAQGNRSTAPRVACRQVAGTSLPRTE